MPTPKVRKERIRSDGPASAKLSDYAQSIRMSVIDTERVVERMAIQGLHHRDTEHWDEMKLIWPMFDAFQPATQRRICFEAIRLAAQRLRPFPEFLVPLVEKALNVKRRAPNAPAWDAAAKIVGLRLLRNDVTVTEDGRWICKNVREVARLAGEKTHHNLLNWLGDPFFKQDALYWCMIALMEAAPSSDCSSDEDIDAPFIAR